MSRRGYDEFSSDEEFQEEEEVSESSEDKNVILHLDADCYELQVWVNKNYPELGRKHIPMVVVNPDGIMLAVNYAAKKKGIKRITTRRALREAKAQCPGLVVIETGTKEGIQDTDTPLEESDKIIDTLRDYRDDFSNKEDMIIEMSSRDEFYIDVTGLVSSFMCAEARKEKADGHRVKDFAPPSQEDMDSLTKSTKTFPDKRFPGNPVTIMEGRKGTIMKSTLNYRVREIYRQNLEEYHYDETRLIYGAIIAQRLIRLVKKTTGYQLSAGVGHNKLIAKLACSRNKPEGITVLPDVAIPRLMKKMQFQDLPGYAGVIGENLREEFIEQKGKDLVTLADIQNVGLDKIVELFKEIGVHSPESEAIDLLTKSNLRDDRPVKTRYYTDTVSQSISLKGHHAVQSKREFENRVRALSRLFAGKLRYRFEKHGRLFTRCSVKVKLKSNANIRICGDRNVLDLKRPPSEGKIADFVFSYLDANDVFGSRFKDVAHLYLTGFKLERLNDHFELNPEVDSVVPYFCTKQVLVEPGDDLILTDASQATESLSEYRLPDNNFHFVA